MHSLPKPAAAAAPTGPAWVAKQINIGLKPPPSPLLNVRFYGRYDPSAAGPVPLVVHFHAGAFVAGSLEEGGCVPRLLAAAGAVVMSLDYPLAPANPFPQAIETGYAALAWAFKVRQKLAGKDAPVFVAGEEAGGNLAAAVALMARDRHEPELVGQILLSPMLDPCMATESLRCADAGPVGCTWADGWNKYLSRVDNAAHPYAAPGNALRLASLPPTLLLTAQDDPLRDEALAYADRLRVFGRLVHAAVLPGPTGWPVSYLEPADQACAEAAWSAGVQKEFSDFFSEVNNDKKAAAQDKPVHKPSFFASSNSISII
ncbi:MAG: alpha/beta hydrolase [Pseudomonadota bacterium]